MNPAAIKKYYIGFVVLGVITIGLTIFTLTQAVSGKQDIETYKKGSQIADDLNAYISKQDKIPENLEEAGIKNVPSTIKYTKKSSSEYEFCATYKAEKTYSSNDISSVLFGSALNSASGEGGSDSGTDYARESLYLSYTYKKGENCQNVKPYSLEDSSFDDFKFDSPYEPGGPAASSFNNSDDVERETDIKALHGQLEAYYAQNGYYPSFDDINDANWRSTNMRGLDDEVLVDPGGSSSTLAGKPDKNVYSYDVYSTGGAKKCGNVSDDCAGYTLTATRDDSSKYTKLSLN